MKCMPPEQFADAWNRSNETLASLFHDEKDKADCFVPLIQSTETALASYSLPETDKNFLIKAGLPKSFSPLAVYFDILEHDIKRVSELRPDKINNGVELPALRYDFLIKIGRAEEWSDCDFCVEEFSGRVYKLTYGSGTFHKTVQGESGGWTRLHTDYPVLDERNWASTGPYFVSSSVCQLAQMMLTFRDIFVPQGVVGILAEEQSPKPFGAVTVKQEMQRTDAFYRRLAKTLKRELRKIDEVAVVRPDSLWYFLFRAVGDGLE